MPAFEDLTGRTFGKWTVLHRHFRETTKKRQPTVWWCRCACGTEKAVWRSTLIDGKSTSCRCSRNGDVRPATTEQQKMPEYRAWRSMKERCTNPKHRQYKNYGGRGIKVDPVWLRSFQAFFDYVGPRPTPQHSLDRYPDVNSGYRPGNVRWATVKQQQRNRRVNHLMTYHDRTQSLAAWAEDFSINPQTLLSRLGSGLSLEEALTKPVIKHKIWPCFTYRGITQSVDDWAKAMNMPRHVVRQRIRIGWSIERALTEPIRPHVKRQFSQ